jgi:crotonobetainyl-CoA:carnitine CoA-transferase CaiB-like acyl-CoA transferase
MLMANQSGQLNMYFPMPRFISVWRAIFLTQNRDEWLEKLMFKDTCVSPVLFLDEVLKDKHHRELGAIVSGKDIGSGFVDQVGMISKMSKSLGQIRRQAPPVGANTADMLKEIGYLVSAIDAPVEKICTP